MSGTVTMSDIEACIRKSVRSPGWLTNIEDELNKTTDPRRRRELEDQLRRRREALARYGEGDAS